MKTHGAILVALALLCATGRAWALTCPGGIVSLGQTTAEVHLKCGDPTLWDQRIEETSFSDKGRTFHQTKTVDEWTYDLGTGRLVETLFFSNGILVKIRSGGYGKGETTSANDRPGIISVGDTKSQVILKWGQPTYLEQHQEERTFYGHKGEVIQQTVTVERLTYDFGPRRFIRILTFENGKLTENRTGGYGQVEPGDQTPEEEAPQANP